MGYDSGMDQGHITDMRRGGVVLYIYCWSGLCFVLKLGEGN